MEKNVLVSIVIPVYNVEKYVGECLDSVLGQTYHNIEVICIDDASTDSSLSVLQNYARQDKRLQVIQNGINHGRSFTRNEGLKRARGKYTYFLDSDDYIKLNAIECLVGYAEKYDIECVLFDSTTIWEKEGMGKGFNYCWNLKEMSGKVCDGSELFRVMVNKNVYSNAVWRQFWRRDFLIGNDLWFANELHGAEDMPFSMEAYLTVKRVMVVDESYHVYRRREGSSVTERSMRRIADMFKGYYLLLEFWGKHVFADDVNEAIGKQLEKNLIQIKRMYMRLKGRAIEKELDNGIVKHLFDGLIVHNYEQKLNSVDRGILERIRTFSYVIVYGAYGYAAEVVERLERKDIKIASLAVTHIDQTTVQMHGIPVNEIKDLCAMKDEAIVVLGVSKGNREDVISTLKEYGFSHYVSLD